MRETLLAGAILVGLIGLAFMATWPWMTLFKLGVGIALLGLILGIPTGAVYHVRLHQCLSARDVLPERWYWSPTSLHDDLLHAERPRVLPWCYAGAFGFLLIALGLAVVGFAILAAYISVR